jgi:DNA-directed RNA polymerase subunit RPC12/RpoP
MFKKEDLLKALSEIKTEPMDGKCPDCSSKVLERTMCLFWGPWGGSVSCPKCNYKSSFYTYIGKICLIVEPLNTEDTAKGGKSV